MPRELVAAGESTYRVALFIETSTKIGRDLLLGIRNFARERGNWTLELWNLELQPGQASINQTIPDPATWNGSGVISRAPTGQFKAILDANVPTVFFTLSNKQRAAIDRKDVLEVFVDANPVAEMATEHLWQRGLRNFAFVGSPNNPDWSKRRELALRKALFTRSKPLHAFEFSAHSEKWIVESRRLAQWVKSLPKPVGILAANDARAIQVLNVCRQGKFSVPNEISIMGVDNDELICSLCDPPLSTVMLASVEAGYRTAEALEALMSGRDPGTRQIVISPIHVIARGSTATSGASDWRVEQARKFIFDNASRLIQVSDVAEHLKISRRLLELLFAKQVGHSLLKEILHVRLEKVKDLLLSSTLPVSAIAKQCGFAHANYLCKVFKREIGCSPQSFRASVFGQ